MVMAVVAAVFLVSNYVDLLTRAVNKNINFLIVTKLALAKVPYLLHESVPFLVFVAAILAFTRLSKSNEYTIIKASGMSIWQMLLPFLTITMVVGVVFITALNPISTALMDYNRKISNKYYMGSSAASMLSFSQSGLWFVDKSQTAEHEKRIVHARYLNAAESRLIDVSFLILDRDYNFRERIDAEGATLKNGMWNLDNVSVFKLHKLALKRSTEQLQTDFKAYDLKNSFIDPQSISIWRLVHFITILKTAGYSALQHSSYFYKLLMRPILMCGLVLIAASFALRPMRFVSSPRVIFYGISSGFVLFFFNEVITLLGANGSIPSYLASIAAALSVVMIGVALLLHVKDG